MIWYESPDELSAGDKVWFMGLKAKVAEFSPEILAAPHWKYWAVPIVISGTGCITIAHVEMLSSRW